MFAALYIGAIEGAGPHLAPAHVYRMTGSQAVASDDEARRLYADLVVRHRADQIPGKRWYADNSREGVRDDTLRDALIPLGVVTQRTDLPTTSSKPRYALTAPFAALFDPALDGERLWAAIGRFQERHLNKAALARISIIRSGASGGGKRVLVAFPSGETRPMAAGPSSVISKAVIEVFAPTFLEDPAVLWLSESGNKVVLRDDELARKVGLNIQAATTLPDLILADLGGDAALLVFVEVVATDGPVHERRRRDLLALTDAAGFDREHVAFVTAYQDRESAGFRKTVARLAWGSFAWFVSEPERLLLMRDGAASPARLRALLRV